LDTASSTGSSSLDKKHSYRSETALARSVRERRLEAEQLEEAKNKFVANVPKLLLEVSLSQFSLPDKNLSNIRRQ
jgi:hypothetical protein